MSTLYNLEPQPTAKVLLQTSSGDILLELFAKQTPLTCRNFLQLCLDGYYTGTIFHRLVSGFIIQGGDPTGTGEGGEAIYDGGLFADEFHSRLKFNRRGLLGMANTGRKDDNGSQFFLTLAKTEELNGKNTMFGRVVGDTIFNLMKMGEAELTPAEGSERPLYPTKIIGTEVLVNPFEDMVVSKAKAQVPIPEQKGTESKKTKKKVGKTLLSFAGEAGEEYEEPMLKKAKFNTKLVTAASSNPTANGNDTKPQGNGKSIRQPKSFAASPPPRQNSHPETQLPLRDEEEPSRSPSTSPEPVALSKVSSLLERTNAQIAELKASMKRIQPNTASLPTKKVSALEQMIPENAIRGRKRKQGKDGGINDAQSLQLLNAFRAKLHQASPESLPSAAAALEAVEAETNGQAHDDADADEEAPLCDLHFIANCQSCQSWDKQIGDDTTLDDDDQSWMSHALTFEKDRLGKDASWKRKNEEELVVIDPREKVKGIKEEQKAKRLAKSNPSTRAWDKDPEKGRV